MTQRLGSRARGGVLVLVVALVPLRSAAPASASTGFVATAPAPGAGVGRGGAPPGGPIPPVTSCSSLPGVDLNGVPGAPGQITSAAVVGITLGNQSVRFCSVQGVMAPQTHFQIDLPTATWHGQYVQEGCATFCGSVQLTAFPQAGYTCAPVDNGEVALASDDEGHTAGPTDGSWAKDSLALRVVFGLTSEHSLEETAQAIMSAYYGRPASYSYFDGCSTGGREALMLAQRYPGDFNGIIAGAPASNMAPLALYNAWMVRSNTDAGGHQILSSEKIPALHAAVIRACANNQGIIAAPSRCGFDPASIQCRPGHDTDACLTVAQVDAVRKFYRGPTDPQGRSLFNGGEPYGSELGWPGDFVEPAADTAAPGDTGDAALALNYFKYMGFFPNPPADFSLADVPFTDQEFQKLNALGNLIYNANNPNLQAFAARGGKLIVYHGWADQAISPWSTLDYYAAVEKSTGGFDASQAFSRLYMVPGGYHCLFAPDGDVNIADFLTPLISWVQGGVSPGKVPAPTYSPGGTIVAEETLRPYDALAPVTVTPASLNGHYDYIGTYP